MGEVGVKTLESYLKYKGIQCRIIYLNVLVESTINIKIKEKILQLIGDSKLIGMSIMSKDLDIFTDLTNYLKRKTNIPIIWGGVHPSVCPDESIEYCDFLCIGEGEEPLYMLYEKINNNSNNFDDIPNIVYKKNTTVKINVVSFIVEDLNSRPFLNYDFKDSYIIYKDDLIKISDSSNLKKKILGKTLIFISQRGCPYACTYCTNSFFKKLYKDTQKKFYRVSSIKRIIDELCVYLDTMPFIERIQIYDDDFLARDEGEIREFAAQYKSKIGLPFMILGIPKFVTDEKIRLLVDSNLVSISLGIQTGSHRILKEIYQRPVFSEDILKIAKILNKYKDTLKISYDLIVDNPYEKNSDKIETIKLLKSLPRPYELNIFSLTFFPGTELYEQVKKDGLIPVEELHRHYKKHYIIGMKKDYFNSVIYLNSVINLPEKVNNFFIDPIILNSFFFKQFRYVIKESTKLFFVLRAFRYVIINLGLLKHYIKYLRI